jgi:hypothetical protein
LDGLYGNPTEFAEYVIANPNYSYEYHDDEYGTRCGNEPHGGALLPCAAEVWQ